MPCTSLYNLFGKTHNIMVEIAHLINKWSIPKVTKTLIHGLQNSDTLVCYLALATWQSDSLKTSIYSRLNNNLNACQIYD